VTKKELVNEEQRVEEAIRLTRSILMNALYEPQTLVMMHTANMDGWKIQDTICDILLYLEETNPERNKEAGDRMSIAVKRFHRKYGGKRWEKEEVK